MGLASLFPLGLLLFIVRCWGVARKVVTFSALVAGFTQLVSLQSERAEALLSLDWLREAQGVHDAAFIRLNGELFGVTFNPDYGELIDGVLVLREGDVLFAQRELRITLPRNQVAQLPAALRVDVLPDDSGELPEIEIMWLQAAQNLPEVRHIHLHLGTRGTRNQS